MTMNTSESITPEHVGSSDDEAQPVRPGPVAGLRVPDLGTVYAAPITAMLLGDWGADVVIENFRPGVMEFQAAGAALAPVYDIEQLMNDPHVQDRDMITTIEDEDLGALKMQNLIFRMGNTPGSIHHGGRRLGQDTDNVLDELLGISGDKLDELRENGVV